MLKILVLVAFLPGCAWWTSEAVRYDECSRHCSDLFRRSPVHVLATRSLLNGDCSCELSRGD